MILSLRSIIINSFYSIYLILNVVNYPIGFIGFKISRKLMDRGGGALLSKGIYISELPDYVIKVYNFLRQLLNLFRGVFQWKNLILV